MFSHDLFCSKIWGYKLHLMECRSGMVSQDDEDVVVVGGGHGSRPSLRWTPIMSSVVLRRQQISHDGCKDWQGDSRRSMSIKWRKLSMSSLVKM